MTYDESAMQRRRNKRSSFPRPLPCKGPAPSTDGTIELYCRHTDRRHWHFHRPVLTSMLGTWTETGSLEKANSARFPGGVAKALTKVVDECEQRGQAT